MPDPVNELGARIREVRKRRGLTQRELATTSGVSLSLIRKLEQGERADTRLETARQLAVALRIPTSRLIAEHHEAGAAPPTVDQWEPVRRALFTPPPAGLSEAPTANGVRAAIEATRPLFADDRLSELTTILPPLLRDADTLADLDPDGRQIRGTLLRLTGSLLVQTRQFDAAAAALERAMDDAADRLDGAATVTTECWLLLRQGRVNTARELATRWADDIEPRMSRATPAELSAWGWLLLRASAAAVRDNRPGEAEDTLRLAQSAAVAAGREQTPGGDHLRAFGPVTVMLKRAETAMVADQPDRVLKLAAAVPAKSIPATSNNLNRHRLDVANAYAKQRRYPEAIDKLSEIRTAAPEWLPHQQYARDILQRVISHRRTLTQEMRGLADAVQLRM